LIILGDFMGKLINGARSERALHKQIKNAIWDVLFNMICNNINIINKPEDVPERWIKKLLFENGQIGVYNGMYCEICGNSGYYVYGEPTELLLRAPNNLTTYMVERKSVKWLGANQLRTGITEYLDIQTNKMAELQISLWQNIVASRSADIIALKNNNNLLSLKQAVLQSREIGLPTVYVDKEMIDPDNMAQIKLSVAFEGDRINQLLQEIYNETLSHYGILNANSNKRERVQVGELEAQSDYAYDSIYTLIDTFNRDAENEGLDIRLELNGAIDDFTPNRELEDTPKENIAND